jgi:membrane protein YqaA with SNARE-associated domain
MSSGTAARTAATPSSSLPIHYDQWYYGVLLSLLASFVGGLGDNFVRYAHNTRKRDAAKMASTEAEAYVRFRWLQNTGAWLLGLFLTVVGNTVLTIWCLLRHRTSSSRSC